MLKLKNITKSFKVNDNHNYLVLDDININFPSTGLIYIMGKSGSGKSTLLNIISGLIKPSKGEVIYNDLDINKFKESEKENYLKNDLGFLFQKYNLIEELSVIDNLKLTSSIKEINEDDLINELLNKFKLMDVKDNLVSSLSGGEKERVSFIRSIINKPRILLCDEPTGALDNENSFKLIDELIEISKDTLVIVVTHNKELVSYYNDGYIELKDTKIIKNTVGINETKKIKERIIIKDKRKKFKSILIKKNIKLNFKKNIINLISTAFLTLFIILSVSFNLGINSSKDKLISSYADDSTFKVSEKVEEDINDSMLSVIKLNRPTYEKTYSLVKDKKDVLINYSFDYFFKGTNVIKINNHELDENINFKQIYNESFLDNEVIVNRELSNLYKNKFNEPIMNKEIKVNLNRVYYYHDEETNSKVKENLTLELNLIVKEVKDEFHYLNEPSIYYNSLYFEELIKHKFATNINETLSKKLTYFDLIDKAKSNDEITSFSMMILNLDKSDNKSFYNLIDSLNKGELIDITSGPYIIVSNFLDLTNSIFLGLNIFTIFIILTSLFISAFLAYSSFIMNKKECAILNVLGIKKTDLIEVFLFEELSFNVLGIMSGTLISLLSSFIINHYLRSFFVIPDLIKLSPLFIVSVIFIFFLFYLVSNLLPLLFINKNKLNEELKEE